CGTSSRHPDGTTRVAESFAILPWFSLDEPETTPTGVVRVGNGRPRRVLPEEATGGHPAPSGHRAPGAQRGVGAIPLHSAEMIPLHDDNPTRRFPAVTVALIAANVAVFAVQLLLPRWGVTPEGWYYL